MPVSNKGLTRRRHGLHCPPHTQAQNKKDKEKPRAFASDPGLMAMDGTWTKVVTNKDDELPLAAHLQATIQHNAEHGGAQEALNCTAKHSLDWTGATKYKIANMIKAFAAASRKINSIMAVSGNPFTKVIGFIKAPPTFEHQSDVPTGNIADAVEGAEQAVAAIQKRIATREQQLLDDVTSGGADVQVGHRGGKGGRG